MSFDSTRYYGWAEGPWMPSLNQGWVSSSNGFFVNKTVVLSQNVIKVSKGVSCESPWWHRHLAGAAHRLEACATNATYHRARTPAPPTCLCFTSRLRPMRNYLAKRQGVIDGWEKAEDHWQPGCATRDGAAWESFEANCQGQGHSQPPETRTRGPGARRSFCRP